MTATTQKEAARLLGVHPNTVATMLDDGRLRPVMIGTGGGPLRACRRVETESLRKLLWTQGIPVRTVRRLPLCRIDRWAQDQRIMSPLGGSR